MEEPFSNHFNRLHCCVRLLQTWTQHPMRQWMSANPTWMFSKLRSSIRSFRVPGPDKIPPGVDQAWRTTSRKKPLPTSLLQIWQKEDVPSDSNDADIVTTSTKEIEAFGETAVESLICPSQRRSFLIASWTFQRTSSLKVNVVSETVKETDMIFSVREI